MTEYASTYSPSRSAESEAACSVAESVGYDHGLRGNKGLPRTMTVNGLFFNRNSICAAGVDLRIGHKRGYAEFLKRKDNG
jgi:hypothetical protein